MARIPDEEIERLKKEVALERLVLGFGVELKRHGAELLGRCPFHEDKTPSLVVSPKTNLWHCLGACNVGGSTIDWVMRTKGDELPACSGIAAGRSFFFSRRGGSRRQEGDDGEAGSAGEGRGR